MPELVAEQNLRIWRLCDCFISKQFSNVNITTSKALSPFVTAAALCYVHNVATPMRMCRSFVPWPLRALILAKRI